MKRFPTKDVRYGQKLGHTVYQNTFVAQKNSFSEKINVKCRYHKTTTAIDILQSYIFFTNWKSISSWHEDIDFQRVNNGNKIFLRYKGSLINILNIYPRTKQSVHRFVSCLILKRFYLHTKNPCILF